MKLVTLQDYALGPVLVNTDHVVRIYTYRDYPFSEGSKVLIAVELANGIAVLVDDTMENVVHWLTELGEG